MKKLFLTFIVIIITMQSNAQKIELKEGKQNDIKLDTLNIVTLLQVYEENAAAHLIGDVYLSVSINSEAAVEFYIDTDKPTKEFYTKAYQNLFLTFSTENNSNYLTIEEAHFEKEFAITNNNSITIGKNEDLLKIELTEYVEEWGYDDPLNEEEGQMWNNILYTLKVTEKNSANFFSFSNTEINNSLVIDIDNYSLIILADNYKNDSVLINMIVNKK